MNWVVIIGLGLAAISTATLGIFAIFQRRRDPVALSFATIMLAAAGWSGGIAIYYGAGDSLVVTEWAVRLYYIAAALIALTIFYLALSIARKHHVIRSTPYVLVALPFLLLAAGFVQAPEIFIRNIQPGSVTLNPTGYIVYCVYFLVYYGLALYLMAASVRHSRGIAKAQNKQLFLGYTISGIIGATFNLILPALGNYEYIWIGPLGLFVFVPMAYITIVKYGLFDIRQTVARTVAYLSTLTVIAVVYAGAITFVSYATSGNILVQTVIILIAALTFQPLKSFFDHLTDRIFYKNTYHAGEFYTQFNEQLASTTDLRSLLRRASQLIAKNMKAHQVFLFVHTSDSQYVTGGTEGYEKIPYADPRLLDDYESDSIVADSLALPDEVRRMLQSHKVTLALRLRTGKKTVGYLYMGSHLTSHFSSRDLKVLENISDSLAIAIQNAVSIHEVRELNDTLQQRIDNATGELRRSNAQLQRLDEAKDEFISMASHQLRTPLTSIKGYLSMLIEGDVGPISKEQSHVLSEMFISSERMVRLIGDFLNVSRLQTGKFVIEKYPLDLALLVKRELDGLVQNASARGLKFAYTPPTDLPMIDLDENKIQQVVMNFCDNAIYYAKGEGVINVTLKRVGDAVEFRVIDNGIGVPKAEQAHLFNKFFRATNARQARPDGTGVGLFLAKKVVDDHKGSIIFESKEGKGSTFGFRLPLPKES